MTDTETYVIRDDVGQIATYTDEAEAVAAFESAPNDDVPPWRGDLVLSRVMAVRR